MSTHICKARQALEESRNLEPIMTDTGAIVVSQQQLDERTADIELLVSNAERLQLY